MAVQLNHGGATTGKLMPMPAHAIAPDHVLEQAQRVAAEAAERARVKVHDLHELHELQPVVDLFDRTWSSDQGSYMPLNLLRALAHAGSHVSAAVDDGQVVGALVGFLGSYKGQHALHSHMLAVSPEMRGRNIGYALKLHQRAWSLERGLTVITWTFDPLMSRNSYLNLTQLGAEAADYLPNFYGAMADSINAADESDLILATWWLAGERAVAATNGVHPDEASLIAGGNLSAILQLGPGDHPVSAPSSGNRLVCWIPTDIDAVRRRDASLALEWRLALRHAIGNALADGYEIEAFLPCGCYLLSRSE